MVSNILAGKEVTYLEAYISKIKEEIECVVINIGGVGIHESVLVTFFISVFLLVFGLIMTSGFRVENPSRRQLAVESFVTWLTRVYENVLGPKGKCYATYMVTIAC